MPGPEVAPGLYGKLPARGDFVSRRLDAEFIDAWDAWLQRAISASREALGSGWLECFLSAPVWRFLVPAGMISKAGWTGLMVPSVDRVGRYFPFTVAAPIFADGIDVPASLARALPWLDRLEALALEALTPELDFEAFDRRLAGLAPPADLAVPGLQSDDTVPLGGVVAQFQVWPQVPLEHAVLGLRGSGAVWLTRGGEAFPPCLAMCEGLIPGLQFCALLDGRWAEHSWSVMPQGQASDVMYCPPITRGVDLIHGQGRGEEGKQGGAGPLTATPSSEQHEMNTGLEK